MSVITVHDKSFGPYLSEEQIQQRVKELAEKINTDYAGKRPLFIAILNGSFMFAADLFKNLEIPAELCFIKLASYKGLKSSGNVVTSIGLEDDLFDKDVIIVEDIVDTGLTLKHILDTVKKHEPASVNVCSLLFKPLALKTEIGDISYIGFEIPNEFVVGYGLDYNGLGRNLKDIYRVCNP